MYVPTILYFYKIKFRGYDSDASRPDIGRLSALYRIECGRHSGIVRTYESIMYVTSLNRRPKLYTLTPIILYLKNKKITGYCLNFGFTTHIKGG